MSWVEKEAGRANRNLLIVNVLVALFPGYMLVNTALIFLTRQRFPSDDWFLLLILLCLLALAVWNIVKAIQRYSDIQKAPVWKQLAVYNSVPMQVSAELEQDMLMGSVKYGGIVVSNQWLVRRSMFSTWVSPIGDLAWIYKKVTRHYTNGIPTGKSYSVILHGRHKQSMTLQTSEKKVDALMIDLKQRVPWAIFGFTDQIQSIWKKDPGGFVAEVDKRRNELMHKVSAASQG